MSEGSGLPNKGNSSDLEPISSPRGSGRSLLSTPELVPGEGVLLFTGDDRCQECDNLILATHMSFTFFYSPKGIEHARVMGGVPSEWRPHLEKIAIPGDTGPPRVAFWQNGRPQVQVHEGPDTGNWLPCSSYTITRGGMPYSLWMCRPAGPENPCDNDFMQEISS